MELLVEWLRYFSLETLLLDLRGFMDSGGDVLWLIAALTLVMWTLALQRFWYYRKFLKRDVDRACGVWQARSEHHSWHAHQIRRALIAQVQQRIDATLPLIATLVALCPLFGLLGTVTGMIEVFHVMAVTGGGDVKAMAGGVSRATIPTMAGMVAALSGVFANTVITRIAHREKELLADQLILD